MDIPKNSPAYIDSLCDLIPNKRRPLEDFRKLLQVLEQSPKECTPFKGKILQHLQIHALDESKLSKFRLLALCYARATILSRKGPNKDEGPVGEWKSGLTNSIRDLDKNLNELYEVAGVNTIKIIVDDKNKDDVELESEKRIKEAKTSGYQSMINDYLLKVNWAAHCICALISIKTEFDLPIPVSILLKIAMKISSLRWRDYKKKPNTIIRSHVYSLTPQMLDISFMLFQFLVTVLDSNIIPLVQIINQTIVRLLEWTRTSNLSISDEASYHSIRSKLFKLLSFLLEQLSLNVNLDSESLKNLLEVEIVYNLESMLEKSDIKSALNNDLKYLHNLHVLNSMNCLENLLIVYDKYLETSIEGKVKNCIIQSCMKIYRDFESNTINLQCRRQLLQILNVIANQPYASSTTEISYHIFELVKKLESDRDMKAIAQKCLKIGLSHRPTIVSSYDVYNCYNHPMLTTATINMETNQPKGVNEPQVESNPPPAMKESSNGNAEDSIEEAEALMEPANDSKQPEEAEELMEESMQQQAHHSAKDDSTKAAENSILRRPTKDLRQSSAEDLMQPAEDLIQAGEDDVQVNEIMSCLQA